MFQKIVKPAGDIFAAFVILLVTLPFSIIAAIVLAIAQKGHVFFTQKRPGKNERIFNLIKFKTMTDERDESGQLLPDDQRLTLAGKIIRKTSIDELPQLLNVLKGEMSLVGPRPLLVEYLKLYNEHQKRRHEVKPGITGWTQVKGRNSLTWEQKFNYDIWYVDHQSFLLDMKILFLTIYKVFKAEGINAQGTATMERFTGQVNNKTS